MLNVHVHSQYISGGENGQELCTGSSVGHTAEHTQSTGPTDKRVR